MRVPLGYCLHLCCQTGPVPDQQPSPPWSGHPLPDHDGGLCDVGPHICDDKSLFPGFFCDFWSCISPHQVWWVSNDEHRVLMCHSSLFFPCHCVFLAILAFFFFGPMSVTGPFKSISRNRRRKRRPRHHQVAERRGCAGTGPLQRSVIHDTIKLFNDEAGVVPMQRNVIHDIIKLVNGDAGLWVACCHRYSQDTHYHFFCGHVLMFCHNHEAITTPSPLPGQAALWGESGCSTRKALPGPTPPRC